MSPEVRRTRSGYTILERAHRANLPPPSPPRFPSEDWIISLGGRSVGDPAVNPGVENQMRSVKGPDGSPGSTQRDWGSARQRGWDGEKKGKG